MIAALTSTWPWVSSNGSRCVEGREQPGVLAGPRHGGLRRDLGPAAGQRDLQDERLVVGQPVAGPLDVVLATPAGGSRRSAAAERHQLAALPDPLRHRVFEAIELGMVEQDTSTALAIFHVGTLALAG